jgi:hypothetical protein
MHPRSMVRELERCLCPSLPEVRGGVTREVSCAAESRGVPQGAAEVQPPVALLPRASSRSRESSHAEGAASTALG